MKIIKELSDMIEDELEGAENYVRAAIENKEEHRELANVFYEISTQEMRHVNMLHEEIVKIIKKHRESHGEPPATMMAIYEWQHNKHIEKSKGVKILQEHYRDGT